MAVVTISPSGGDDTSALQNAINSTASAGNTLQLQAGIYRVSPLTIPSGANIQLLSGVTVTANSGYGTNQNMLNINGSNVVISGAGASSSVFQMTRSGNTFSGQMVMRVDNGASNVTISGVSGNTSAGDGLYVATASNITVNDCIFNNNVRQGSSIIGPVNGLYYNRCQFTNTNGSPPSAGIDIEPNTPSEFLQNIHITDCVSTNNAGNGILVSLQNMTGASQPVSITVLRHTASGNGTAGIVSGTNWGFSDYLFLNAGSNNAPGFILFQDCTSTNSAYWAAVGRTWVADGAAVIFKNLSVTNPHQQGPDPSYGDSAAVALARGGGGTALTGNAHFINTSINVTNGKVNRYFNFFDNSSIGVVNVQFIPGSLSGASISSPIGQWQGTPIGAIH